MIDSMNNLLKKNIFRLKPFERQQDNDLLEAGNIDIHNRPVVHNPDGSISTVRTITVSFDDGHYNLPTVVGGRIVSEDEAVDHFRKTGEHLGRYRTVDAAVKAAQKLHEEQAAEYRGR